MRIVLIILLLIHGLMHLMGFVKSISPAKSINLTKPVTRTIGLFWLIATVLFILTAILILYGTTFWWLGAIAAVVISQALIFAYWNDAKFGTVLNILIVILILVRTNMF